MTSSKTAQRKSRARLSGSVHARTFDEEVVLVDLAGGEYYALDAIGSMLWNGLANGRAVEEIAVDVAAQYDVSVERAADDLMTLAEDMASRGLLQFIIQEEKP